HLRTGAVITSPPAQLWLTRGAGVVQAAHWRELWRLLEELHIARLHALCERDHHVGKAVKFALWLGFCGLDQHGAVDDQWEVGRERVIALVQERLGDVDG